MRSLLFVVFLAVGLPVHADDALRRAVASAARLASASVAFDSEVVLRLTHPKVFNLSQDPDKARRVVKEVFADLKRGGIAHDFGYRIIERISVDRRRSVVFAHRKELIAFIPYEAVEKAVAGHVRVNAFYLGISEDAGKSWRFVDGAQLDERSIAIFVDGYTGTPRLPERSKVAIE